MPAGCDLILTDSTPSYVGLEARISVRGSSREPSTRALPLLLSPQRVVGTLAVPQQLVTLTAVWLRQTGGHLGSSLGVVELTTALLHVFSSPDDKIVYDVGHQAYVHKMLTGRRKLMPTIRQTGGISGACGCCAQQHSSCPAASLRKPCGEPHFMRPTVYMLVVM